MERKSQGGGPEFRSKSKDEADDNKTTELDEVGEDATIGQKFRSRDGILGVDFGNTTVVPAESKSQGCCRQQWLALTRRSTSCFQSLQHWERSGPLGRAHNSNSLTLVDVELHDISVLELSPPTVGKRHHISSNPIPDSIMCRFRGGVRSQVFRNAIGLRGVPTAEDAPRCRHNRPDLELL